MAIKNVYEVFEDFRNAKTKQERLEILRNNDSYALRNVLLGAYNPTIQFIKVPSFNKVEVPPGLSYSHMTEALSKVYLFVVGNKRVPEGLTDKRKEELLIQLLESLEEKEANVFADMMRKDLKVPHLTTKLVNEAFPGLLPE